MKHWKRYGPSSQGLFLDDNELSVGTLYFEEGVGFYFRVYIGDGREDVFLNAETLENAEMEAEKWLTERYKKEIETHEHCIKFFREIIGILEQEG